MKKSALILVPVLLISLIAYLVIRSRNQPPAPVTQEPDISLPINTLPLAERPFITLAPDDTGKSLVLSVDQAPTDGEMEYELIYNASGKQEGALGSLFLSSESQPIKKSILLGSKSGGGKITYHEGVSGGSLTLTYGTTRLKESWNFLEYNSTDPSFSTTDAKLTITLPAKALKDKTRILSMKTFGYPKTGLPQNAKVVIGPYSIQLATPPKGEANLEFKLPSDLNNPVLYRWDNTTWTKLPSQVKSGTMTAKSPTLTTFLVIAD